MRDVGGLIHTTAGTWITRPPVRCPSSRGLGGGPVLVGCEARTGYGGGEHITWSCRTCADTVCGPLKASHCTASDRPPPVRISNRLAGSN
ncbi:hypothetical protein [Mycobacterium sp. MMS18-G62]